MPLENRLRGHQRRRLVQQRPTQTLALPGQPGALSVRELQPLVAVQFLQHAYLLLEILDYLLLLAVHPTRQHAQEKLKLGLHHKKPAHP